MQQSSIELLQEEINFNQEHTICRLKKYRILSDTFRNKLRKYNQVSDIVASMVNYRIMIS